MMYTSGGLDRSNIRIPIKTHTIHLSNKCSVDLTRFKNKTVKDKGDSDLFDYIAGKQKHNNRVNTAI